MPFYRAPQKTLEEALASVREYEERLTIACLALYPQAAGVKTIEETSAIDQLVPVDPARTDTSPQFRLFIGKETWVQKNICGKTQADLYEALRLLNWQAPIFANPYMMHTVVALYEKGEISHHGFHLLHRMYVATQKMLDPKDQNDPSTHLMGLDGEPCENQYKLHFYKILDESKQFSEDFKRLLKDNLQGYFGYEGHVFDDERLESIRLTFLAFLENDTANVGQNVFFWKELDEREFEKNEAEVYTRAFHVFVMDQKNPRRRFYFSDCLRAAIEIECVGVREATQVFCITQNITHLDIQTTSELFYTVPAAARLRITSTILPGSPEIRSFHNFSLPKKGWKLGSHLSSYDSLLDHDVYHATLMSLSPLLCRVYYLAKQLLRIELLQHVPRLKDVPLHKMMSSLAWVFTENEFARENYTETNLTTVFANLLVIFPPEKQSAGTYFYPDGEVTDSGIVSFLSMARKRPCAEELLTLIDPELFPDEIELPNRRKVYYKNCYEIAKIVAPYATENAAFNILLYRCYKRMPDKDLLPFFAEQLKEKWEQDSSRITIILKTKLRANIHWMANNPDLSLEVSAEDKDTTQEDIYLYCETIQGQSFLYYRINGSKEYIEREDLGEGIFNSLIIIANNPEEREFLGFDPNSVENDLHHLLLKRKHAGRTKFTAAQDRVYGLLEDSFVFTHIFREWIGGDAYSLKTKRGANLYYVLHFLQRLPHPEIFREIVHDLRDLLNSANLYDAKKWCSEIDAAIKKIQSLSLVEGGEKIAEAIKGLKAITSDIRVTDSRMHLSLWETRGGRGEAVAFCPLPALSQNEG